MGAHPATEVTTVIPREGEQRGPFRPGELVNPRLHATMDGLPLRGLARAHEAELLQVAADEEISPTAAALLALLSTLPRPQGRPLGVGLQLSVASLAAVLGRSVRMVHYALRQLEELGLVKRFTQIRAVRTITRARALPLERFAYVGKGGQKRWTTKAHCTAVLYPTLAGLDVFERHGWTSARHLGREHDRRTVRVGVVGFLLETLSTWIRALSLRCASVPLDCTPYESKTSRDVPTAPSSAAANGMVVGAPLGAMLDAHRRTDSPARDSAHESARRWPVSGGGCLTDEVERCWSRVVDVDEHRVRPAPRGYNVDRWRLGFGYEPQPTGRTQRVWSPIMNAAQWMPEAWARGSAEDRAVLTARFDPIRAELERRVARGEKIDP